jgi:hypothetical protein
LFRVVYLYLQKVVTSTAAERLKRVDAEAEVYATDIKAELASDRAQTNPAVRAVLQKHVSSADGMSACAQAFLLPSLC